MIPLAPRSFFCCSSRTRITFRTKRLFLCVYQRVVRQWSVGRWTRRALKRGVSRPRRGVLRRQRAIMARAAFNHSRVLPQSQQKNNTLSFSQCGHHHQRKEIEKLKRKRRRNRHLDTRGPTYCTAEKGDARIQIRGRETCCADGAREGLARRLTETQREWPHLGKSVVGLSRKRQPSRLRLWIRHILASSRVPPQRVGRHRRRRRHERDGQQKQNRRRSRRPAACHHVC